MTIWKSPHEDVEIPENVTTWQWAFTHRSPSTYSSGSYISTHHPSTHRLSFPEVKTHATHLSTALVNLYGLRPEQTVTLLSPNSISYPVAMWAALRVGARVNGASPAYGVEEVRHVLRTAGTRVVFTTGECLDAVLEAGVVGRERVVLLEGRGREGLRSLGELVELGRGMKEVREWCVPEGKCNREVCGYLNFSSGTTGLPKAVMLSHHNIIAQCHQLRQLQVVSPGDRYRILAVMPLFHITGLVRFCTYPVLMNGDCFMMPKFDLEEMMKAIIQHRIEELILVPPILIRIVKDPVAKKYLPQLRQIVKRWSSGSAPISPEIIQLLRQQFPDTGFRQGYGATESTACISAHPPSHFDYKYATTGGKLVANTIAKVISLDDPSRQLGPGETGEICAKGPQIAMGYLDNPRATAETIQDGWFHTGDVGNIDEEGLIRIEDRIKEMIKVKGQQVAPAELEDLLLGHEIVEDAAVLGVPDEYSGERPKAVVVLKPGLQPSEELGRRLLAFVKEKKIRYKWVKEIEFQESIPKSPTGKLLRRVLKAAEKDGGRKKGVVVRDEGRAIAKL